MNKKLRKSINASLFGLGLSLLFTSNATATEVDWMAQADQSLDLSSSENLLQQVNDYSNYDLNQVNSVNQLRDVSPGDWAYEALNSLVERYGCIAGYPNQTYRGNQALTRYEFAAGLNACLNQIEQLIASSGSLSGEDLETIQRLAQEFSTELVTLGTRIDDLESKIATLEDNQFSTTTVLFGEVVLGLASVISGENVSGEDIDEVPILGHRTRLGFATSFTGEDLLYTTLSAGNFPFFEEVTGTYEGDLGFGASNDNNDVGLLALSYSFPVGDRATVFVEGYNGVAYSFTDTFNPLDQLNDSATGAISFFGTRNPIYNQVAGSGIGIRSDITEQFEVSLGYLSSTADDPSEGAGLFNGAYGAIGQLVYKPNEDFKLGVTYVHAYNSSDTFTGSNLSNFRDFTETEFGEAVPVESNSYGVQASWNASDRLIVSGWVGYTEAEILEGIGGLVEPGDQEIWNWAVTLAFPDLGREGNLGGIVVGMEPKVTDSTVEIVGFDSEDQDTSLHVEAFYQYQLNDNITITPGVIWTTAPDHNNNNDDIIIGTVRTTFNF